MNERLYLDSNVLISLLLDEIGSGFRLLAVEAMDFIEFAVKNNCELVLSDLFYKEVERKTKSKKERVQEYLSEMNVEFENVKAEKEDFAIAGRLEISGIQYPDSLHAAIALRAKCNAIVTFNTKDFEKAREKIKIAEPKDFSQSLFP